MIPLMSVRVESEITYPRPSAVFSPSFAITTSSAYRLTSANDKNIKIENAINQNEIDTDTAAARNDSDEYKVLPVLGSLLTLNV